MELDKKRFSAMPPSEKAELIAGWLAEKKGDKIVVMNLEGLNAITEGLVIAGAGSVRHAQGLADYVLESCRQANFEFLNMEGYQAGQWILLDCNDVIVNILQEEPRKAYRLEDLWPKAIVLVDNRPADDRK